jgi:RND family efflux transporter MFP subunit
MSQIAFPTESPSARRGTIWVFALLASVASLLVYWSVTRFTSGGSSGDGTAAAGMFHLVKPVDLDLKVGKLGELQAVNNIDILCRVEGQTTVQTLVKEGTTVKKGDVLITLDSSAIKQKIEDTTLELQKAEADAVNSKELREIQISQNNANLEAAQVELDLAQIALKEYEEGTHPQALSQATSDLELAKLALKNKQENLAQTRNLFAKNFLTATDLKKAEEELINAQALVNKANNALEVLTKYTHESNLASKRNAVSQAEQKLARTKRENAASMNQKDADVQAKQQALDVLKRRMERYQEQLAACTITAPADGMVVYVTSGDRNAQNALQEGVQVRERQALLRLPDTSSMKAVVRIGEAQVWRLREGQRARVRLTNGPPMMATLTAISVLADNTQRWMNPDVKEFPVDLTLDSTPPNLKPGMGAECEILIDRVENALAVPLASIYSSGNKSYVFVRDGDSLKPTPVEIGRVNETHAEVRSGLNDGQQVKILAIGEGQEMLARAGIIVESATDDGAFKDAAGAGGQRRRGGRGSRGGGAGAEGAAPPDATVAPADAGSGSPNAPASEGPPRRRRGNGPPQPQQPPPTDRAPGGN